MKHNLSEIRTSFGFSQEELAAKLGKDVSTISRWERGKTREPLLSPIVHSANRKYQYVKTMMDQEISDYVYSSEKISGLFYSENFMIMTVSKWTLKRYPLLRAAYGFSATSYFRGDAKRLFNEKSKEVKRAFQTPGSSAYCRVPPKSGLVITEGLVIDFKFIGYNLVHVEAHAMTSEEAASCTLANVEFTFG